MYILSYSRHGDIIVYEVTEVHLPPAHHSHRPSHIHCFISSTHLEYLLGLYWTGLTLLNGFPF